MICVSIGRSRHKMIVHEHRALAEKGAELVELRLDWLAGLPNLARLINDRPTPVVITCRRKSEQGRWTSSEDQRITVLRAAIAAGVEYVDLEEDVAQQIQRYADTKRIVSHHDFEQTPEDLEIIHARLCKLDPDIVKLVTMANSANDMVRVLRLVKESDVPTVGFCMGEWGLASRVLCGKFGAPFTYASFSSRRVVAPGQLSFDAMKDLYRFDSINSETQVYGVLGDPIGHSLSPLIHNTAFRDADLNCVYLPFRVAKNALSSTLDEFELFDVRGYSVTIPHKQAVLEKSQYLDEAVQEIGAANTLFKDDQGHWRTSNTDYDAALESIRLGLSSRRFGDADTEDTTDGLEIELKGKKVLMFGAGGVARAIGLGIVRSNAELTITNRTHQRAIRLAEELGCQHIPWADRDLVGADILINCTPVGMHPNVGESPFSADWLNEQMLVFDTVYNPEETVLIGQAREKGCRTVTGLEMFVRQAAMQFQCFTGKPVPLEQMQKTVREYIDGAIEWSSR